MNAATETVKRHKLTQEDCDTVRYLLKYGRTLKEIGEIISVDPSTVGKIRLANYDLQTYLEQRKQMNRKTKERKAAAEAGRRRMNALLDPVADEERDQKVLAKMIREEQAAGRYPKLPQDDSWKMAPDAPAEVPGQMKMDLEPAKGQKKPPTLEEYMKKHKSLSFEEYLQMVDFKEPENPDAVKMMRCMAKMADRIVKKLDEIRDVLKGGAGNE